MKERRYLANDDRTYHQSSEVPQPAPIVCSTIHAVGTAGAAFATDRCRRPLPAITRTWLLPRPARTMASSYADRRERGLREPDFRRGVVRKRW
jgi:hypothetical protein